MLNAEAILKSPTVRFPPIHRLLYINSIIKVNLNSLPIFYHQEIDSLSTKLAKAKTTDKADKKQQKTTSDELEMLRQETKRLSKENEEMNLLVKRNTANKEANDKQLGLLQEEKKEFEKTIKDLRSSLTSNENNLLTLNQEVNELQTSAKKLSKQKEELTLGIALRDKKIKLFESELEDLQSRKTNDDDTGVGKDTIENGTVEVSNKEVIITELRDQLRKAKHKAAAIEAELEQLKNSYQTNFKAEQEEMENKWAKRLRKECSELQAELAEKYAREKRVWLKKENELQNMIRQMKMLLDKRAKEAAQEKKRLEQELTKAKTYQGSMASLDSSSISDDAADGVSSGSVDTTKETTSPNTKDGLNDRDLRRVAYKLTNDEWSQLGTFLGVADSELNKLLGLNMGPQEKAFRLLGIWRTQSPLGKNQLVSQLAVALEEINRKDVAQFVVEQMMSGKPRKKFFGW